MLTSLTGNGLHALCLDPRDACMCVVSLPLSPQKRPGVPSDGCMSNGGRVGPDRSQSKQAMQAGRCRVTSNLSVLHELQERDRPAGSGFLIAPSVW